MDSRVGSGLQSRGSITASAVRSPTSSFAGGMALGAPSTTPVAVSTITLPGSVPDMVGESGTEERIILKRVHLMLMDENPIECRLLTRYFSRMAEVYIVFDETEAVAALTGRKFRYVGAGRMGRSPIEHEPIRFDAAVIALDPVEIGAPSKGRFLARRVREIEQERGLASGVFFAYTAGYTDTNQTMRDEDSVCNIDGKNTTLFNAYMPKPLNVARAHSTLQLTLGHEVEINAERT